MERFVAAGGSGADDIAATVAGADVVITMLPDSPDVEAVLLGADGVFAHAPSGALLIDCSTIRPDVSARLATEGAKRRLRVLDAPVSGGEQGAVQAALSIMVGGSSDDFAAASPILEAIGTTVLHVGPAGSGQTVKAANQLIVAGSFQLVAEAIVFIEAHGVDTETAVKVLAGGLAGNAILDRKGAAMLRRDFRRPGRPGDAECPRHRFPEFSRRRHDHHRARPDRRHHVSRRTVLPRAPPRGRTFRAGLFGPCPADSRRVIGSSPIRGRPDDMIRATNVVVAAGREASGGHHCHSLEPFDARTVRDGTGSDQALTRGNGAAPVAWNFLLRTDCRRIRHDPARFPHRDPGRTVAGSVRHSASDLSTGAVDLDCHRGCSQPGTFQPDRVKVGGHQASSASMVDIMVALWFCELTAYDRVSVKPHASPVLHAINYLLGDLDPAYLPTLRAKGGLQSYPSRLKDPDTVDFSTGSVGIGATAALWAAMSHRYLRSHFPDTSRARRFISLLGDAELDEGAIWEAVADPAVAKLGELLWVVDLNRQSLDRVVPDIQIARLQAMFAAAGWQVLVLKWGRRISAIFEQPGGQDLRRRLEEMPNEEYQRMLRVDASEIAGRIMAAGGSDTLRELVSGLGEDELAMAIRDLGGHDLPLLVDAFGSVDNDRPTAVFAYTVKGRGLPTEGHPNNHSALLTEAQMLSLAEVCGTSLDDPWRAFEPGTPAADICARRAAALRRETSSQAPPVRIPTSLGHPYRKAISTQASLGRLLADLPRDAPEASARVVTCSPDVASSTNLGGWINKTGVWSVQDRRDWFSDDTERVLKWSEVVHGQHIELGIAEVNLVGLLGELGATWSRWGERLIPIATLYDPFLSRALEPWSYGIYAGGQSILVGTPSGVTLAPEGGAHQSITTPSIGLEQPGCVAWEPAFAQDLEWTFLHAMAQVGIPGGTSAYFRLSTRPIDPALARLPEDPHLVDRRRRQAVAGGYRLTQHALGSELVTLVGVGAIMPEVLQASDVLGQQGITVGVVCLTSPDLVFRSLQQRGDRTAQSGGNIVDELFPPECPAPLVTVLDGHPHTLSFLAAARGDRTRCLGVTEFGQSSDLNEAHRLHGIDPGSIVDSALSLLGR